MMATRETPDAQRGGGSAARSPFDSAPLWMFRATGGWRGLNTLILEVSNGYPSDLRKAIEGGHCGIVRPGDAARADVLAVVAYAGISGVALIEPSGRVHPRPGQ